eukprot:TRINITY_DN113799_c0_g1_i1.p1 TRINITY_DN113799_c0_g1~~TRINITY_DN113799_c0_g1_i1.p1  ORF type:complete len:130 (+),score=23.92 TRINITY_DN113799_c0_g1_i1:46-435(+)
MASHSVNPSQSRKMDLEVWSQTTGTWNPVVSAEASPVSKGQLTVTFYLAGVADGQLLCRKTLSRESRALRKVQKPGSETNNDDDMPEPLEADPDFYGWFFSKTSPKLVDYEKNLFSNRLDRNGNRIRNY